MESLPSHVSAYPPTQGLIQGKLGACWMMAVWIMILHSRHLAHILWLKDNLSPSYPVSTDQGVMVNLEQVRVPGELDHKRYKLFIKTMYDLTYNSKVLKTYSDANNIPLTDDNETQWKESVEREEKAAVQYTRMLEPYLVHWYSCALEPPNLASEFLDWQYIWDERNIRLKEEGTRGFYITEPASHTSQQVQSNLHKGYVPYLYLAKAFQKIGIPLQYVGVYDLITITDPADLPHYQARIQDIHDPIIKPHIIMVMTNVPFLWPRDWAIGTDVYTLDGAIISATQSFDKRPQKGDHAMAASFDSNGDPIVINSYMSDCEPFRHNWLTSTDNEWVKMKTFWYQHVKHTTTLMYILTSTQHGGKKRRLKLSTSRRTAGPKAKRS